MVKRSEVVTSQSVTNTSKSIIDVQRFSVLPQDHEISLSQSSVLCENVASPIMSDRAAPSKDSNDKSRKSRRLQSKPLMTYCEKSDDLSDDLTDDSEGEDFNSNQQDSDSEDQELDCVVNKGDWRHKPRFKPPESDREDEDDESLESVRLEGKVKLEEKMKAELNTDAGLNTWEPDEQDLKDLHIFFGETCTPQLQKVYQ